MVFWRFPFNEVVWIANSKGGLLFSATLARESGSHSLASSSTVHEILTKFNFVTACFIWDLFPSRFLETMRDFKHSGINLLHYFSYCDFNRLFFDFVLTLQALDIYPDNPRIHLTKANSALAVSGVIPFAILWKAFLCFNTREDDDDYSCEYQQIIDYFGHSEFVDRWHFRMLNDRRRNLAYKAAIQQVSTAHSVLTALSNKYTVFPRF